MARAMSLILVLLLLLVVFGVVARLVLIPRGSRRRDDSDVTDPTVIPPAHPDSPIPGSSTQRRDHGKP